MFLLFIILLSLFILLIVGCKLAYIISTPKETRKSDKEKERLDKLASLYSGINSDYNSGNWSSVPFMPIKYW